MRPLAILLVPSNGVGLGHVTRAAAIARSLADAGAVPVLCTLSPVVAPFQELGLLVEHLPSYRRTPLPRWHWQRVLEAHLLHLIEVYGVSAVVFDGVSPYRGVLRAMAAEGAPPYVWVRRGRRRADAAAVAGHDFRLVLEPGEVGAGPLASGGAVAHVAPIMLHRRDDILSRSQALTDLGWDPTARYGLISLGTGAAGALTPAEGLAAAALQDRGVVPVVARSPLLPAGDGPPGSVLLRRYPLAPVLQAFDVAVIAAGYNSVAEMMLTDVPTVVVPNPDAAIDDQHARASSLADQGFAAVWEVGSGTPFPAVLAATLDGRADLAQRRVDWIVPDGATRAADAILQVCR